MRSLVQSMSATRFRPASGRMELRDRTRVTVVRRVLLALVFLAPAAGLPGLDDPDVLHEPQPALLEFVRDHTVVYVLPAIHRYPKGYEPPENGTGLPDYVAQRIEASDRFFLEEDIWQIGNPAIWELPFGDDEQRPGLGEFMNRWATDRREGLDRFVGELYARIDRDIHVEIERLRPFAAYNRIIQLVGEAVGGAVDRGVDAQAREIALTAGLEVEGLAPRSRPTELRDQASQEKYVEWIHTVPAAAPEMDEFLEIEAELLSRSYEVWARSGTRDFDSHLLEWLDGPGWMAAYEPLGLDLDYWIENGPDLALMKPRSEIWIETLKEAAAEEERQTLFITVGLAHMYPKPERGGWFRAALKEEGFELTRILGGKDAR